MRLLHLDNVAVIFPGRTLLERTTWSVFRGDRYGLVGVNGSGKTTLLRLLARELEPSAGTVSAARDLVMGYLPQEPAVESARTLFEEAWIGLPDLPRLEREIISLREQLALAPTNEELAERLGVLQHRWEDLEGYRAESKVARVLSGLGFRQSEFARPVGEFSGGWRARIALGKLLLLDPDVLLLDEPTNHLDLPALLWLEGYLRRFGGSLVVVSHDRGFLDRAVDRIAAVAERTLTLYGGNYSKYEETRAARDEQAAAEAERASAERRRIEAFISRFRYKATKAKQVQSRIRRLAAAEPVAESRPVERSVRFRFPPAPPSGRVVLELHGVAKSYGSCPVFHDVNVVLTRGEKVALVGANGAGKTTLCRLIAGVQAADAGRVQRGHNVVVDCFAQEADSRLDSRLTVLQQMEAEGGAGTQAALRGLLGAFLFSGDDVFKPISVLSGGEKSRLALATMLLHPSNLMILDEPTNHLDMASQDVLLDALRSYDGTLLVVSHDRYFLDGLVGRVLELEGGILRDWPGTLSEYIERKGLSDSAETNVDAPRVPVSAAPPPDLRHKTREQKRAEAQIRNRLAGDLRAARDEVDRLQEEIQSGDVRLREIEAELADESLYRDGDKCRSLLAAYERLRRGVPELIAAWERAATRLEELETQKREELRNHA